MPLVWASGFGHEHLGGGRHHRTDGGSLGPPCGGVLPGHWRAAFLLGASTGLCLGLHALRPAPRRPGSGLGSLLAGGFLFFSRGLGFLLGFLRCIGRSTLGSLAFALLTGFAFAALLGQLGFRRLISSAWRRALPRGEPGQGCSPGLVLRQLRLCHRCRFACGCLSGFVTFDERTLLAHLDLDGARLPVASACLISLVDLVTSVIFRSGHTMAGLQVGQKLCLSDSVRTSEGLILTTPADLRAVQAGLPGFFEFGCKLDDGITGHIWFVPPLTFTLPREPVFARLHDQGLGFFFRLSGQFGQFIDGQVGQIVTVYECRLRRAWRPIQGSRPPGHADPGTRSPRCLHGRFPSSAAHPWRARAVH